MAIIEHHQGCNANPVGCMGPWDDFYTIFGTEIRFLTGHAVVSAILGLVLLSVLFTLKKKGKIRMPLYLIIISSIVLMIILFFLSAYLFPVKVYY